MGLDMYLNKMPRYRGATAKDVVAVENYLDWIKAKEKGSEHANCTFEEWCGIEKEPRQTYVDFYKTFYKTRYSTWDTEHKYGYDRIIQQVGYWRKANHIHNWFVENVQDGEDDCDYHHEVTEAILEELLKTCKTVLKSCKLVDGEVSNGYHFENGKMVPDMVQGKIVEDPTIAMELLPTASGFFFGGTDYDEWYIRDIEDTIDIITDILQNTDFDTEMVYYVSSW